MSATEVPLHSSSYKVRRFFNWFPLGLTYAFLYMGRYNLTVAKNALGDLMTKEDFGIIFAAGTFTYAFAFLLNGPLTDKMGGRKAILVSAIGVAAMNLLLGMFTHSFLGDRTGALFAHRTLLFSILYAANMYFQSFGAVSIVKVNASWFHVRERGIFGGIFGILISLGLYFAFDWGDAIAAATVAHFKDLSWLQYAIRVVFGIAGTTTDQTWWVFWIPAAILVVFAIIDYLVVFDKPSKAGHPDFDTGDASSGDTDETFRLSVVLKKIITSPIMLTIAMIEFCSGVMRNGMMHWYTIYVKELVKSGVITDRPMIEANWGLVQLIAGVCGGMLAGWVSDHLFGSRRGPVAALQYSILIVGSIVAAFFYQNIQVLSWTIAVMMMAVIGVHGMLSGTSTMDFGGRKAAGTAVGMIDGMVYLGTGLQSLGIGYLTSSNMSSFGWVVGPMIVAALILALIMINVKRTNLTYPIAASVSLVVSWVVVFGILFTGKGGWGAWQMFLIPFAVLGTVLAVKIWFAFPNAKGSASH